MRVSPVPPPATRVESVAALAALLCRTEAEPLVGLDTETTGLDPHRDRLRTLQIATVTDAWVIDTWAVGELEPVRRWLAARAVAGHRTLLHNAKFDINMLRAAAGGAPIHPLAISDLLLWSLLLGCGRPVPGGHGLAAVADRWLSLSLAKDQQRADWTGPLTAEQVAYAARDAWVLLPLAAAMRDGGPGGPGLRREGLLRIAEVEDACVPAVADMEYAGIGFDLPYWQTLTAALRLAARETRADVFRQLGGAQRPVQVSLFGDEVHALNLESPAQVKAALRAAGVAVTSTAEAALKPHVAEHPAVAALLRHKKNAKLLSAFADALPRHLHPATGRIHPAYHQLTGNALGRFSCANPNIQQIPHDPRFRRAFTAPAGRRLVIADLSQIELRIMCRLSGDARMLQAYRQGEDLHRLTASLLAGVPLGAVTREQRQMSKAANFGLIYAMSAAGLRAYALNAYGIAMTAQEADTFRRRFFASYAGVLAFHRRQDTTARRAREVRTLLGRCRRWADGPIGLPELVNTPTQGTGADILKRAMGLLRPALLRTDSDLVASVHDELVVECPVDRAEEVRHAVRGALEAAGRECLDPVPVQADAVIGTSWADKP